MNIIEKANDAIAWGEGYDASKAGNAITTNPYAAADRLHSQWNDGWKQAPVTIKTPYETVELK